MRRILALGLLVSASAGSAAAGDPGASVSRDSRSVSTLVGGKRVVVLRACAGEKFSPDSGTDPVNPRTSPDGRWLLVDRIYPFQPRDRISESTVLLDVRTGRSFDSAFLERAFPVANAFMLGFVPGSPATLPGPLASKREASRCE